MDESAIAEQSNEDGELDTLKEEKEAEEKKQSLRILIERCRKRLITWGHDTGASSRRLDHSLRKSLKLRSNTLELLQDIFRLLTMGI